MASSWKVHDVFSTEDGRFRVSLQSPMDEPQSYFLDLRRWFEKGGEFFSTKRGIRVNTSAAHLKKLDKALRKITRGEVMCQERAGLCLLRQAGMLHIRKTSLTDDEIPIFVVLNSSEAMFLSSKLTIIYENVTAMVAGSDEDEMEQWK